MCIHPHWNVKVYQCYEFAVCTTLEGGTEKWQLMSNTWLISWCAFSWYQLKLLWHKQHETWFWCIHQGQIYHQCTMISDFSLKIRVIKVFFQKFCSSFFKTQHSPVHVQKWNVWHMSYSYTFSLTLPSYSRSCQILYLP